MKQTKKALFLVLIVFCLCLMFCGCENVDPNVKPQEEEASSAEPYEVITEPEANEAELPAEIDLNAFANRSYELRYLFAVEKFDTPAQISINVLVQYAINHIYYTNLVGIPSSDRQIREATTTQVNEVLQKHFNLSDAAITSSVLYNSGKGIFEMWQLSYDDEIYYTVKGASSGENKYTVSTTFYTAADKTQKKGSTTMTVSVENGKAYILKMTSEGA